MRIGGHLSIAGGYHNALTKCKDIGGNCLQIFSSSPRNWGVIPPTNEQIAQFLELKHRLKIDPIYFHASYLINLADSTRVGNASVQTLIAELHLAQKMGVKGTIIHLGSFKQKDITPTSEQYEILFKNIQAVLAATPQDTFFIIENAGNKKICCSLDELALIVKTLNNPRVKVCLDTCHLWGAGYDLSTYEKFDKYFSDFAEKVGMEKLELFQVNDSKDPLGSFRDRHENIGVGTIPISEFKLLVNDPRTGEFPFLLEVPGLDKKGPDKENVAKLLSLRNTSPTNLTV